VCEFAYVVNRVLAIRSPVIEGYSTPKKEKKKEKASRPLLLRTSRMCS